MSTSEQMLQQIVRADWSRLMSAVVRDIKDIELAEDVLADALESALVHWGKHGVPEAPHGWLIRTARRKAIDRIRRDQNFAAKQIEYAYLLELDRIQEPETEPAIADEQLALMFTCAHPALNEAARVALVLQVVSGIPTAAIAKAFMVEEAAMAQRLVRAKRKIRGAGVPFQIPEPELWDERLQTILGALYLVFNAGYVAADSDVQIDLDLCEEALRLIGLLDRLCPEQAELEGLHALMLLHHARAPARVGSLNRLSDEDRTLWDAPKITQGLNLVEVALKRGKPGFYQYQAAISAVHAEAASFAETRWGEIVLIYQKLLQLTQSPVVQLNQAVALSYATSAEQALAVVESLKNELCSYQPFHAAHADLLRRCGRMPDAFAAYQRAIAQSTNRADIEFLRQQQKIGVDVCVN